MNALLAARFTEILDSLKNESDRGCVLVVGSLVELAIEDHISKRILPPVKKTGELVGRGSRPIATFSAKIDLAYALGLFPEEEWRIYHQLRELRNTCAHEIKQQNFNADHFSARMLNIISASSTLWPILATAVGKKIFESNSPVTVERFVEDLGWRVSFEMFFSLVIAHKETSADRVPRIKTLYATS
ncbi:hypothetical protein HX810_03225 [Pseudomonas salomonii]|uniref:Mannitol repressor n=1 Tax=Pseudomonas salomonii TaxID=191391 RepID=A0A7Y8GAS4_9PSED|nr:hypothetical protein [Pseudomonas salomonii]NWF06686.1 hypothetical protein [Pseudomonas salomonii]